jgi:hypothetical protein
MNLYGFIGNDGINKYDYLGLLRKFYNDKGFLAGSDRKYIFWSEASYIEGPNGPVWWCGKRYWEVWQYDEKYLSRLSDGIEENWEPKMKAFYLRNKGSWVGCSLWGEFLTIPRKTNRGIINGN